MDNKDITKSRFSKVHGYEFKTLDDGTKVPKGYISTTHLDSGFYDDKRNVFVRDRVDKATLDLWAKEINAGNPRANKMSVNHNRIPHVAGRMTEGTAQVHQFDDGEHGLFVETPLDATREDAADISYRIDNGFIDSYSIEFTTKDANGNYLPGAVNEVEKDGFIERTLLIGSILEGATYASQPMLENAVMMKEVKIKQNQIPIIDSKKQSEDYIKMETKEEAKAEAEVKTEAPVQEEKQPVENKEASKDDVALLAWAKEQKEAIKKADLMKEMKEQVMADVKESLKTIQVENKTIRS